MPKYKELKNCKTYEIPIDVIYFDNEFNSRGIFAPQSCLELAESMKRVGLQVPIILQPSADVPELSKDFEYRIVAGHRRFTAAARLLQWDTIPAMVMTGLSEEDARTINLLENLERKNLSLYQEAVALRKTFPMAVPFKSMATAISKSESWCRLRWAIMELPPDMQKLVEKGVLKSSDLPMLAFKSNPDEQRAIAAELQAARLRGETPRKYALRKNIRCESKTQREIGDMMAQLMAAGIVPDAYKAMAWAAGKLTDEELLE